MNMLCEEYLLIIILTEINSNNCNDKLFYVLLKNRSTIDLDLSLRSQEIVV